MSYSLNTEKALMKLEDKQLKWFRYLERMYKTRMLIRALQLKHEEARPMG
jgi:hypothetical protein